MQSAALVKRLHSRVEVLLEAVAKLHADFSEKALSRAECLEVLIHVQPLHVSRFGFLLEIRQEIALLLLLVEEVVAFVHDALVAAAAQSLGFLGHAFVVFALALVTWLGEDVDAERFVPQHLHRRRIAVAGIVVEVETELRAVFYLASPQGYSLANILHNNWLVFVLIIRAMTFIASAKMGNDAVVTALISRSFAVNYSFTVQNGRAGNTRGYVCAVCRTAITRSTSVLSSRFRTPTFTFAILFTFTIWQIFAFVKP